MVASLDIRKHFCLLYYWHEGLIDNKIVESSSDILISQMVLLSPPSVLTKVRIEFPEGVYPPLVEKPFEAHPLICSESRLFVGICSHVDVYLFMRNIEVSRYYHSSPLLQSSLLQLLAVTLKGYLILLCLIVQSLQLSISSTRHVHHYQVKVLVLQGQNSTLLTEGRLLKVLDYGDRRKLREDSHPRVAGRAFAEVPVVVIGGDFYLLLCVELCVDLGLIDADEVGLVINDDGTHGILIEYAANAVDIPQDEFELRAGFTISKSDFQFILLMKRG